MMKVSIITPCYNAEKYIAEAILSVISQQGDFEIEYVIVDGGSTDRTHEIICGLKRLVDSGNWPLRCKGVRLTYISERDEGMYDALAKGLRVITGDIVAYINSDDCYLPNAFAAVKEVFSQFREIEWVTGVQVFFNEHGNIIHTWLPLKYDRTWILKGMYGTHLPFIQQESTFWRRRLVDRVDLNLLRTFKLAGDFFLWHTFAKYTNLFIVKTLLGGFRVSENQLSRQREEYYKEFHLIAEHKRMPDMIFACALRFLGRVLSDNSKLTLNREIIRFHNNRWWKPDTARLDKIVSLIPSQEMRSLLSRIFR